MCLNKIEYILYNKKYYIKTNIMLNLKKKRKQKKEQKNGIQKNKQSKRASASYLRLCNDIKNLDVGENVECTFPDENNIKNINFKITPNNGMWEGASYNFTVLIPDSYPFDPPKCLLNEKIYHPNIDFNGHICLNILRREWQPTLDLSSIIFGILYLFYYPNPNDPLNTVAGENLRNSKSDFEKKVKKTLRGEAIYIKGEFITGFTKLL